jgi:hypothetical protein
MKFLLITLILGFTLTSCHESSKHVTPIDATGVVLMIDVTDDDVSFPNAQSIQNIYDLHSRNTRGASYTLVPISDVQYAPITHFEIPPRPVLLQNPGERQREINGFLSDISSSLEELKTEPSGKPKSEVYTSVAHQLNALASDNINEKHIIIYSDLFENTDLFSVYKESDRDLLCLNPDAVEKLFSNSVPLVDLKGISVDLIYTAPDYKSSKVYGYMSSLYRKILESKNAKVTISGSFTNENKSYVME